MQIESVESKLSSETELACNMSPLLDNVVFAAFKGAISSVAHPLYAVQFRHEGARLYVTAPLWSSQLRENIERTLTNAENTVAAVQKAEAEKTALENQKNQRAIDTA